MDISPDPVADVAVPATPAAGMLDGAAAAFGMAAIVTILFNTLLAWIKDAFDPLNDFMALLTGHHWITHGLIDVAVFVVVGSVLLRRGYRVSGNRLALGVAVAAVVGGGGLMLWFVLF
jgi:hypothetical protein